MFYQDNDKEMWDQASVSHREFLMEKEVSGQLDDLLANVRDSLTGVMVQGAKKHGAGSWADPCNASLEHKANHASLFRHLSESYCSVTEDVDSGHHPLSHVIIRCLMAMYRANSGADKACK